MFVDPFSTDLPSSSDPANFDERADAYYGHLPTFVAQLNALAALLAETAAPPISIPYAFSATTTVADPTDGKIRLNNATQASATALLADLVDGVGLTVTGLLDQFDDSTSTIKGYLRLTAVADPLKWLVFAVTALASPSGYRNITIQSGVGSGPSPFADGDLVTMSFVPKGDKGDTGPAAGWTDVLSGGNLTGLSQFTLSSIPTSHSDLAIRFDYTTGVSSVSPTVSVSSDGVAFSTPVSFMNTVPNGTLWLLVNDYRSDRPVLQAMGTGTPSAPPSGGSMQNYGGASLACSGGISSLRVGGGASWLSGTLHQPRAR